MDRADRAGPVYVQAGRGRIPRRPGGPYTVQAGRGWKLDSPGNL